ncbi:unnamed protein product [Closterium sp. NIES-65]|nr:unnamed protein product [Closterium sp. NIES-65]
MELAMTRAIGEAYTTNATRFREEGRHHMEVNDELQLKADDQEKQNVELRQQLEKRDTDLKDALALLKHLAEKIADDQLAKVNWRVHIKESCDDFLFKPDTLNLSPDPDAMLAALISNCGPVALTCGPAALTCGPPPALNCGPVALTCGPAALTCGPAALTCGPVALTCGPAALTCGPAALTCGPVALTCGPAALTCGPAALH